MALPACREAAAADAGVPDRRELPYDWKDVRQRLQRQVPALLRRLKIDAPIRQGLCMPLNPRRADRHAGSFVIWCEGEAAGAWKDYACDLKGDVFDLVMYLEGLARKIDAYWWALDFLGLGRGEIRGAAAAELDRRRAADERAAAEKKRAEGEAARSADLLAQWLKLAPIAGTVAETYLREARGIPLERLAHPPGALRFSPRLEHIDEATGEVTYWPAMVAAMTRGVKLVALHRTWLEPRGRGKAEVAKPKKMIGPARGSAIRLSSGPSGLSPTKAAAAGKLGPLAIGEGIETCLTVAAARPDYRVWAAGSLSLMGLLEWPQCVSAVCLLRDNDWHPDAHKAFDGALEAWRGQALGRPVTAVASAVGSDFNDWARASA
jgi:hypothetical protein